MNLCPVEHFLSGLLQTQWGKKCSTGQRFICTEVTSYKIHILVSSNFSLLFIDEEPKAETLAIRFASAENTKKFKDAFDSAVVSITEWEAERISKAEEAAAVTQEKTLEKDKGETETQLSQLSIKDAE